MPELTKEGINRQILWEINREISKFSHDEFNIRELKTNILALAECLIEKD